MTTTVLPDIAHVPEHILAPTRPPEGFTLRYTQQLGGATLALSTSAFRLCMRFWLDGGGWYVLHNNLRVY